MIKTIIFIFATALVVWVFVWLADYPGSLSIAWYGGRLELDLTIAFIGTLFFAISIGIFYRLWWTIRRAPKAISKVWKNNRRERGYKALTQGMVAVAAGDSNEAKRQAEKADNYLGNPPLTMLLSAQAAQLNGDEAAATRYFQAMLKRPETAFLGLRGLLMQAERDGDRVAALSYASRANILKPKTPWVLSKLFELEVQQLHWKSAITTLDQSIKANSIKSAEAQNLRAAVLLGCSIESETSGEHAEALRYSKRAQKEKLNYLPAIIQTAQLMNKAGKRRSLNKLIKETWGQNPHPILADLYVSDIEEGDHLLRIKKFEELKELNPDHAESRIALVRSLIDAKIWGPARTHLEKLCTEKPSSRICHLMAELEEGDKQDAEKVRHWLVKATDAPSEATWICSSCGTATFSWAPLCHRCGDLGTLAWGTTENFTSFLEDRVIQKLPKKNPNLELGNI